VVAAQKAFQDGRGYVEQQELYTLTDLLEGFDQMDSNMIYRALNNPFIKNLDNEYTKVARTLQQKFGGVSQSSAGQAQDEDSTANEDAGALL